MSSPTKQTQSSPIEYFLATVLVQVHTQSFGWSKIREKSLKIWAKTLKTRAKWRPTLFDFKKWHPTFAEKHMKTFFWRSHQKTS